MKIATKFVNINLYDDDRDDHDDDDDKQLYGNDENRDDADNHN